MSSAQDSPLPPPSVANEIVYQSIQDRDLRLYVPRWPEAARAALVFIHGGGWTGGAPDKLFALAHLLADHGIACCLPQYRLLSEPGMDFSQQIADVRLAWQVAHATLQQALGPQIPVAFGGGSAGGHLALMALFHDESQHCPLPRPAAWVLANPVIDTSPEGFGNGMCGPNWQTLCPRHVVKQPLGKELYLQGLGDTTTTPDKARAFVQEQEAMGTAVKAHWQPDAVHAFFNSDEHRATSAARIAQFLLS